MSHSLHAGAEVKRILTHNDSHHAYDAFPSREDSSHDEDQDCHRDGSDGQPEFDIASIYDDHDELDGKTDEQEEVKFEKRNVDLECQVPPLHAQVCTDMLVNRPGKFVIQFPSHQ